MENAGGVKYKNFPKVDCSKKGKSSKARTELNEILWIFFGVHTANAVRIAKRLAQEKPSKSAA